MPKKDSFFIMESVRKGKGLKPEWIELMKENNIPQWYIDSCLKIKYLFPKAHAVAYVMMAIRIAWFKVHHPYWYYVAFFTLRCDAYEIETMVKGMDAIKRRMDEIQAMKSNPETKRQVTKKDEDLYSMFEACLEMYARGYRFSNIDIDKSLATEFRVLPGRSQNNHSAVYDSRRFGRQRGQVDRRGAGTGRVLIQRRSVEPHPALPNADAQARGAGHAGGHAGRKSAESVLSFSG